MLTFKTIIKASTIPHSKLVFFFPSSIILRITHSPTQKRQSTPSSNPKKKKILNIYPRCLDSLPAFLL